VAVFRQNRADFSKISSILLLSVIDNKPGFNNMSIKLKQGGKS